MKERHRLRRQNTIMEVLAIAIGDNLLIHQINVVTTYVQGELVEVHIQQLKSFEIDDVRLQIGRILQGLKQARRA